MRNPFADNPHASWRRWGERDPYYAVLLDPRHRRANLTDGALADLYAGGERYVAWLEQQFDRLAPDRRRHRALDFGCGVGRITLAMARRYQEVIGIDIAPGMLREARRQAERLEVGNVRFAVGEVAEKIDALCAFSVLQHMNQAEGEATLRTLLGLMNPGAVGAVHMLVADRRAWPRKLYSAVVRHMPLLRLPLNALRRRPLLDPLVQMNTHSIARMVAVLHGAGAKTQIADALGSPAGHVGVEILFHLPVKP